MTSVSSSNCVSSNMNENEEEKDRISNSLPIENYDYLFHCSKSNQIMKTGRALSCNEERIQSTTNNNRFKHLCTRLKRRFSISKDYRTRNEDTTRGLSVHFSNYKSFSSSSDDKLDDFDWPDFERIYDTIPQCLAKTLPGLDDISLEDEDKEEKEINTTDPLSDEIGDLTDLYKYCKRGKHFRRNAICRKIDKNQYHGQLDTFIQQLMVEKLMRTWT